MLAFGTYLPQKEKVVKKHGEQYATTADKTVFNGPFKVQDWKVEDKIQLVKMKIIGTRKSSFRPCKL